MNIFFTSMCPEESARNLCQRHVVKMILESAQMLSTAHRKLGTYLDIDSLYKATHKNHPSSVWVRRSTNNYLWLYKHFVALCELYTLNTGKLHATDLKLRAPLAHFPIDLSVGALTPPPACMPVEFICPDVRKSYQDYLTAKYKEWQSRAKPLKVEYPHGFPDWLNFT